MGWKRPHILMGWVGNEMSNSRHCSVCAARTPGACGGLHSIPSSTLPTALGGEGHVILILQMRQRNSER